MTICQGFYHVQCNVLQTETVTRFLTGVLSYTSTCCHTNMMNFNFRLYLAVPDVMQAFITLFCFAKLASIVHTIGFAGFTGTNGSICFHQVSYLKRFLSSSLYKDYSGSFQLKKKQVPRYKFTIKPSFYVHSNSYIDNNNNNDINIYVSNGRGCSIESYF